MLIFLLKIYVIEESLIFLSGTSFAKTLSWGQKLSANKKNG